MHSHDRQTVLRHAKGHRRVIAALHFDVSLASAHGSIDQVDASLLCSGEVHIEHRGNRLQL